MAGEKVSKWGVIVVGVDGSDSSKLALKWAAHQAQLTKATLRVVTTWSLPATLGWVPQFPEDFNPAADAAKVQKATISEVLGDDPSVTFDPVVLDAHPAEALIEMSNTADLVVVGNRGHGGFAGLLIGSVSENVVTHAHCPVVVIRPGSA